MDTGDWVTAVIAGLALVGSAVGFLVNRGDVRRERKAREAELALLKRQVDAEDRDREKQTHAQITAADFKHDRIAGLDGPHGDEPYAVTLTNLGPSWAKHIQAWLADETENRVTEEGLAGHLDPSKAKRVKLEVPEDVWSGNVRVALWVRWSDDSGGPYEERSNLAINF